MKEGSKIKVHMYDVTNKEIQTNNIGKIFKVYKKNGKLGIDWRNSCNHGDAFVPFEGFAYTVIFEDVETGTKYHMDNVHNKIEQVS